jgi:hypothetical protein
MTAEFRLTGSLAVEPSWSDNLNASRVIDSARSILRFTLADGDGPGQADGYYKSLVKVDDGDAVVIDVEDLPRNVFGGTGSLDLAAVKVLLIRNLSPDVAITAELGTSVTGTLDPGGVLYATSTDSGWAETTLTITNGGGDDVDVEVILAGVQAS